MHRTERGDRHAQWRWRATGYGTPWLTKASACAYALRHVHARHVVARARAVAKLPYLIGLLCAVPRTRVLLSHSPAGERIRAHLQLRRWGLPRFRLAQGILHLPSSYDAYLRGRRRQAVRTNIAKARAEGIKCTRTVVSGWIPPDEADAPATLAERWQATNQAGIPVGEAWIVVDDSCALMHSLISSQSGVRWLLHCAIVEDLCDRRCRVLLTNSHDAVLMPAGAQYFQHRLGYSVERVQPASLESVAPSSANRRLRSLLALGSVTAVGQWALASIL